MVYHWQLIFLDSQGFSYVKRITAPTLELHDREELLDENLIALIRVEKAQTTIGGYNGIYK